MSSRIFIVCGYVASGKTTVANELARTMGVRVIRTDDLRKELFPRELSYDQIDLGRTEESAGKIISWIEENDSGGIDFQQVLNPLGSFQNEAYGEIIRKYALRIKEQKQRVYNEAFARLSKILKEDKDIIFDATFSSRSMRERAYRVATENGLENIYIVQITCDEDIVKSRLANRRSGNQATTSNAKQLEIFRVVKKEFDESHIQKDNPEGLSIMRIVYDTGIQKIEQFGKVDGTTRGIGMVLTNLSEKYGQK
ncbi:MAG: AAA family ATPase [Candidatus Paceibacterota bacterium]